MNDIQQPAAPGARNITQPSCGFARSAMPPAAATVREFVILFAVTIFLLLYGLVPIFGGDQLGLVGADEPRYAQIAREMLTAHSDVCHAGQRQDGPPQPPPRRPSDNSFHCLVGGTVTPILYGKPWLEKPALYYWRAMSFFKEFGVSDWSARLPSSSGAFVLVVLIFLHMRRFRPGGQLDAALITASCVAIVSFARGASTDMQLAAPFCIGMLGWYAWYETGKKFWLFDLYFFGAAATLAKGPVAPFLALVHHPALRRPAPRVVRCSAAPSGCPASCSTSSWCCPGTSPSSGAIPTFYRIFFLEHNLERFATNRYQHHQPFWYYLAVLLLGLMPWTVIAIRALVDAIASLHRRVEGPPQPQAATSATPAPATPSPSSSSSGRSSPSSSSPSPDRSCPATSCPPSRRSPSSPPTTSTASAATACPNGCSGPMPPSARSWSSFSSSRHST